MAEGLRWRNAIVISLLLHGVMLVVIGWMAAKTFASHEVPEQYMELELTSEVAGDGGITENASSSSGGNNLKTVSDYRTKSDLPLTAKAVPNVQTYADNMSVLATEPGIMSDGGGSDVISQGAGVFTGSDSGSGSGSGSSAGSGTSSGSGTGPSKSGSSGGISSPGILARVDPVYPERARQNGQEGTVVLKIQILENGRPGYVSVYNSSGSELLDDAAVEAVRQWRFIPARERESGRAIVCYTTMPVVFRLRS